MAFVGVESGTDRGVAVVGELPYGLDRSDNSPLGF